VLAVGLTFWALAGLNQTDLRSPENSRYLYPSAVFVLLIAAELLAGAKVGGRTIGAVAALATISVAANLVFLSDTYKLFWKPGGEVTKGNLRALEIAGPLNPAYELPLGFVDIRAGSYLSAVDAWGSPAYSEAELATRPESTRAEADKALGAILDLRLQPGRSAGGPCRSIRAEQDAATAVEVGAGTITLQASGSTRAKVHLGRFSDQFPYAAGALAPGSRASLTIPVDDSARLWRLGLRGRGPVIICRLRAS
jgi:hypothetical protein